MSPTEYQCYISSPLLCLYMQIRKSSRRQSFSLYIYHHLLLCLCQPEKFFCQTMTGDDGDDDDYPLEEG